MFAVISGWGAFAWYVYKAVRTREFKNIIMAAFFILMQLTYWPFSLDKKLVFGIYGISFATMMLIEQHVTRKIDSVGLYVLGFILLGSIFLSEFFAKAMLA